MTNFFLHFLFVGYNYFRNLFYDLFVNPIYQLERYCRRDELRAQFDTVDKCLLRALIEKPDGPFDHMVRESQCFYFLYSHKAPYSLCAEYFLSFYESYYAYMYGRILNHNDYVKYR